MNKIIKEEIERLAEVYVTKTYGAKQETWKPTERAIAKKAYIDALTFARKHGWEVMPTPTAPNGGDLP